MLIHAAAPDQTPEMEVSRRMAKEQSTKGHGRGFTPEELERSAALRRGKPLSPEHKLKMSMAMRGRKRTPEHQAKLNAAQTGRPKSPETRAKISATLTGRAGAPHQQPARAAISAAQRERWKEVRSPLSRTSYEYRAWRVAVLERDGWQCRKCGASKRGRTLHAHHIRSFKDHPELRFSVDNGLTLCASCHTTEERLGHVQPV